MEWNTRHARGSNRFIYEYMYEPLVSKIKMLPNCRTGLLILTAPVHQLMHRISPILNYASACIRETLYVHLQPGLETETEPYRPSFVPVTKDVCSMITSIYTKSALLSGKDVRVLLNNISNKAGVIPTPRILPKEVEVVLMDCSTHSKFQSLLRTWFVLPSNPDFITMKDSVWSAADDLRAVDSTIDLCGIESYRTVVLGGTFDQLHAGHKILLSESAVRAEEKIIIGVTEGSMLKRKKLCELIQPLDARITGVCNFIRDVKPDILQADSVVPISDPFGPSVVDPTIGCIIVSEETRKGGEAVNVKRQEKGLSVLDIHEISLAEDTEHSPHEEAKISSSSTRIRLLGKLLRPPQKKVLPDTPYVIGVTGGIASGKSSVCRRLEQLGATVIDCDKLGHKAYLPGTWANSEIVRQFGQDVVGADGTINRQALGAKVFQNRSSLDRLNQIVWPEIARMVEREITTLGSAGQTVCVLDAAVLLEAGWDALCYEVWSCVIHRDEALKRVVDRDHLPEDKARQRIESQVSDQERVDKSNVVFCTFWEPEVTQKQVETAWSDLIQRLPSHEDEQVKFPKL